MAEKLNALTPLPIPIQSGDIIYVVRSGENYKFEINNTYGYKETGTVADENQLIKLGDWDDIDTGAYLEINTSNGRAEFIGMQFNTNIIYFPNQDGTATGEARISFTKTGNNFVRAINITDASGDLQVTGYTAPASSSATGSKGERRITSDFTYDCIETDTWVRTAVENAF